ncbi:MAG: Ig-like domain-containing protein [Chitinivorax sp.]
MSSIFDEIAVLSDSVNNSRLFNDLIQPINPSSNFLSDNSGQSSNYANVAINPNTWVATNNVKLVITYDSSEISFGKIGLDGAGSCSVSSSVSEVGNIGTATIQMTSTGGKGFILYFEPLDNSTSSAINVSAFTLNGVSKTLFIPKIVGDFLSPTIKINTSDFALTSGEVADISFTLSEASTNFTSNDITFSGGVLSYFSGSGSNYSAKFTPLSDSTTNALISVASGTFADASGNANTVGNQLTMTVNTLAKVIQGTATNDQLVGGAGAMIDGLGGIDTIVYSGQLVQIAHNSDGSWMAGSDTLKNIERIQFSGRKIALDIDGNAGKVAKILASVFGPSAVFNKEYAGIGLDLIDGGMTYEALAGLAINATGAHTRETVVDLLWTNLMGSHPTLDQAKPFVDMLSEDLANVGSLGVIASDYAAIIGKVDIPALSQIGLEYV